MTLQGFAYEYSVNRTVSGWSLNSFNRNIKTHVFGTFQSFLHIVRMLLKGDFI